MHGALLGRMGVQGRPWPFEACLDPVAENGRLAGDAAWHQRWAEDAELHYGYAEAAQHLSAMAYLIGQMWVTCGAWEVCA